MPSYAFTIFWLIFALLMLIIEIGTVSLVSIWFCAGALIAAILSFFQVGFVFQIIAFFAVSILLFLLFKQKLQEYFRFRHDLSGSGSMRVLGKNAKVLQPIGPGMQGRVFIDGLDWKATSPVALVTGQIVKVVGIHGVTLEVQPLEKQVYQEPTSPTYPPIHP